MRKVRAAQKIFSEIFAAQKRLRKLAPEFRWRGLGNLLGDLGELIAIEKYGLIKAPAISNGFDAKTKDGRTVQVKTFLHSNQIGFRGTAKLLLVIQIREDGSWREAYFGEFKLLQKIAKYSKRDNKYVVSVRKLSEFQK